jgi:GT2 family glycosyltransferase
MTWTVIVFTYESPRALELSLLALARTRGAFETVVADDGSSMLSRGVVAALAKRLAVHGPVRRVSHPHAGFRKCRIANHAIAGARGERFLFLDGDCLAPADLIERHDALLTPGRYVAGAALRLDDLATARLDRAGVEAGLFERASWRLARAISREVERPSRSATFPRALAPLFRRSSGGWNGGCSSTWRELLFNVNGYDERFSYGFEDTDLGHRLQNAGVRPLSARLDGLVVHLYHPRPYLDLAQLAANSTLARASFRSPIVRAQRGLAELADGEPATWESFGKDEQLSRAS